MMMIIHFMQEYGSGRNQTAQHGEQHHKVMFKVNALLTNRIASSFTDQVAKRYAEMRIRRTLHQQIKSICPNSKKYRSLSSQKKLKTEGKYLMEMSPTTTDKEWTTTFIWHDCKKRILSRHYPIADFVKQAIITKAKKDGYKGQLILTGATAIEIMHNGKKLIIRSSPNFKGKEWYDWVLMEWPKQEYTDGEVPDNRYCLAKVHGFARYEVKDYPTFWKRHGKIPDTSTDSNYYMIVDVSAKYIERRSIAMDVIHKFEVMNSDRGLRIFPLTCIKQGIAVIPNFKTKTSTHYLALCPREEWKTLFTSRIHYYRCQQSKQSEEGDKMSINDEEEEDTSSDNEFENLSVEDTSDDESSCDVDSLTE